MKKVMFMVNSLNGGGAEKVLQTLLSHLDYSKYDVTLYSMHRENIAEMDYPDWIHYKVVFDHYDAKNAVSLQIHNLAERVKGKFFTILPSKLFYSIFFHEKFDVEVAFIEGESTKIISGSTNKHSKKYAWVHIDLQQNPWTAFLYKSDKDEKRHYDAFDKIFCVSESVRTAFLNKYGVVPEKVAVQYNPIDRIEILQKAKSPCDVKEKTVFRMIAVGRLVNQKGFDRLIKIASKLRNDGFEFEILILGEGDDRPELESLIQQLALQDIVHLLGFRANPYSIMATGDLLVCSSRSEGFSTVVTEGVILGLPVISTDCAGIHELFGLSKCGIITENRSEALYEALKSILSEPNQLVDFRNAATERGKYFSLSNTMRAIEDILNS